MSADELDRKVKELRELRRMQEELAAEVDNLAAGIKAHMARMGIDTITGTDWKVTYKPVQTSRIDTAALKKAMPGVAEAFARTSTTFRFIVA